MTIVSEQSITARCLHSLYYSTPLLNRIIETTGLVHDAWTSSPIQSCKLLVWLGGKHVWWICWEASGSMWISNDHEPRRIISPNAVIIKQRNVCRVEQPCSSYHSYCCMKNVQSYMFNKQWSQMQTKILLFCVSVCLLCLSYCRMSMYLSLSVIIGLISVTVVNFK